VSARGRDLISALTKVNASRMSSSAASSRAEPEWDEAVREAIRSASHRLAVYGSLAPGEPNHHVIEAIRGAWTIGFVRGQREESGWGSGLGYPAITWKPDGDPVPVKLLTSPDLPLHWRRLDSFEGAEYVRILVPVEDEAGGLLAVSNIYASA
jgi:gamma-glutamylcyclotransferase (GGCT)/AIG2-like uncharacterized protein YtfP